MRVLVLGLGSIGKRHARNFRALGVEEILGFDPDPQHAAEFLEQTGGRLVASEEEGLAERPDLVVIASPNRFHLDQALRAAEAGLPMFIEKPLGTDLDKARRLHDLVAARDLYVHVGSNWKFHPAFQRMKAIIADGALGRLTAMQVLAGQWLPDWHPWEDFRKGYSARRDLGGGAIFDTHELDYITWLAGQARRFVGFWQQDESVLPIETEHTAAALMELEGGVLVTLLTDYIQRRAQRRYFITGDRGSLEWDLHTGLLRLHRPEGVEDIDVHEDDLNEMYLRQSRQILEDLQHGRRPVTSLSHVLHVLALQLAWHGNGRLWPQDTR